MSLDSLQDLFVDELKERIFKELATAPRSKNCHGMEG